MTDTKVPCVQGAVNAMWPVESFWPLVHAGLFILAVSFGFSAAGWADADSSMEPSSGAMDEMLMPDMGSMIRPDMIPPQGVIGGHDIHKSGGHTITLTAGLNLPTGSTDERDDTPAGLNQLLPYPMQNGSGTFDLLPGITYTGFSENWSWGSQFNAIARLGENDDSYTLGNVYSASVWSVRRWDDWLSSSARLIGKAVENIDGADPRLNPLMVATADPNLRAGNFLGVGLGLNSLVPSGAAEGVRLSVEGIIPAVQDLDGPQIERDYTAIIGLRKMS